MAETWLAHSLNAQKLSQNRGAGSNSEHTSFLNRPKAKQTLAWKKSVQTWSYWEASLCAHES